MSLPEVVSRTAWLDARRALLAREKEMTRTLDVLNADRRRLPMVLVEAEYSFESRYGPVKLIELFGDRSQLAVYHFMFDPNWDEGCPGCTAVVDAIAPAVRRQLGTRDTSLVVVSAAPLAKLEAYATARGWDVDWVSSDGTSFNADFGVTIDADAEPAFENLTRTEQIAPRDGAAAKKEISGLSYFLRRGDQVFHTYTTYQRGTEALIPAYHLLDLSPLGRQEDWELPHGRVVSSRPADPSFGGWGPGGPPPSIAPDAE